MPKFHFQNGLVGCSPTRIPGDAQKLQLCALNAQKMSVMRSAYVHWGKEIILPKLGPYNALHLQSILFNISKHSQIWAMKIQNIMWFQLCKASPKSKPGTIGLAPAMFVFPLNV